MEKLLKIIIKNKKIVLIISIVLLTLILLIHNKKTTVYAAEELTIDEEINTSEDVDDVIVDLPIEIEKIKVDIKGEVKNPGVYELLLGTRIIDVVTLSGGFTDKAITKNVNLSKKIYDEMVIIIPDSETTCEVSNYNIDDTNSIDIKDTNINSGLVNINTATKDELLTLTGIGESKALAIIEYRKTKKFDSIEDIMNITGIKESLFDKIKDEITV